MKTIVLLLLLLAGALHAAEPVAVGEWSAPVKGLRGRIVLAEDAPFHGTRLALVYLELQNVTGVLGSLLVDFESPHLEVVDAAGQAVEQSHPPASVFSVKLGTLVLPFDSTLRFRISVSGYGLPDAGNGGLAVQLRDAFWLLPPDGPGEQFLTGTFRIPELKMDEKHPDAYLDILRKDLARGSVWRGTLQLPKVKLPVTVPK